MRIAQLKLLSILWLLPLVGLAKGAGFSDKIVLEVGDHAITRSEFDLEKAFFVKANQVELKTPAQAKQFEEDFAKMYAELQLQLSVGQQLQIHLDADDHNLLKRDMYARHGVKDEKAFDALLSSKGVSSKLFMLQAQRQFLLKKIHGYVLGPRIRLSDKEVDQAYQQRLAAENLLYVEDIFYSTEHANKAQYPAIQEKSVHVANVWAKGTFTAKTVPKRAKMLSFKWEKLDAFPQAFRAHVAGMKPGDVSAPIQTDNGYHVLKLIKKKLPKGMSIDKEQIKQAMYVDRMAIELPKWLNDLREQTYVRIQLD